MIAPMLKIKVASLLKLPGFDDSTLTAGQLTTKLINELGLLYDPTTNAITFRSFRSSGRIV